MIVSEIFYGVKCNRCGGLHDDGEHTYWFDESTAEEYAQNSDWISIKGKHYCPECYSFDEERDDNLPKPDYPLHLRTLRTFIGKTIRSYGIEISEQEEYFTASIGIWEGNSLQWFEEDYIKNFLGENLISLSYKKHERYTRYDCIILIKK